MSVLDLVARCTTESCDTSVRVSICDEEHYDDTKFSQKLKTDVYWASNLAEQQYFLEHTFDKALKH